MLQVDLHDCEIGASGARSLAAALENARDAVESESSGGLTAEGEANGSTPVLARKIRLQVLRLNGNPLGFSGTSALKPLLSQLKELHLGRAGLGDEGDPSWCIPEYLGLSSITQRGHRPSEAGHLDGVPIVVDS